VDSSAALQGRDAAALHPGNFHMQFRVLALGDDGSARALVVDASDAGAARRMIAHDGMTIIELNPVGSLSAWGLRAGGHSRAGGSGASASFDVDLFCQELYALVTAGVTIGEALETLAKKERKGLSGSRSGSGILIRLHERVREGLPLSAALSEHPAVFPKVLCESLRAAERTSDYGPALERFVRYRRLTREVREKLVAASIYPMILLGVSTLVLLFLVGYVVPRFADVYADMGDKLPAASRVLLWIGSRIGAQPALTAAGLVATVLLIVAAIRSVRLRAAFVSVLHRIPRLKDLLAAAEFSRLYRTLALLLHGGIPMVAALQLARGLLPLHLARRLDASTQSVSEGQSFSASMLTHGLSTEVADRFFRVGEGSGKLAEMIDRAADFHEGEVARGADWLGRVIGPLLMLIMGVVIGLVVVLMYMPIFSLAEAIQ
jgi:general secretion pathway protein F